MTDSNSTTDRDNFTDPRKTLAIALAVCICITIAAIWGVLQAYQNLATDPTLPPPGIPATPAPEHLALVLETASASADNPPLRQEVRIRSADNRRLRENLTVIAQGKGWFAHNSTSRTIQLVLPVSDLHQMEALAADPTRWVRNHHTTRRNPRGPASTDLVNIQLDITSYHGNLMPWAPIMVAAIVSALFFTALTAFMGIYLVAEMNLHRRRARPR